MRDEKGFGTLSMLALLPALFTLVFAIAGVALVLHKDAELKHTCRTEVLKSQEHAAHRLNQLIALNPVANAARKAVAVTTAADKIAPPGPPKAAAMLAKSAAIAAQRALQIRQLYLIAEAERASKISPIVTTKKLMTLANAPLFAFRPPNKIGKFELLKTPRRDPTPGYDPARNFSKTQTVEISIEFPIGGFLPEWLRDLLKTSNLKIKTSCSATIEKEGNKWVAKLKAVNS